MSDVLVEVHGTYVLADGTPAAGSVLLTPVAVAGMSAAVKRLVTRHSVVGRLDGQGSVTLNVLASDDPDWMVDGPVLYEVAEYIAGARGKAYQVHIPGPGPVDLADLQPVDEPQTVAAFPVPGPRGQQGPPGIGIRILSAVPTVADLPAVGEDGDAHLVIESGDLWVWGTDGAWHDSGHVQGPPGPPGDAGTLNDLTDVDTTRDATGMVITRQPDGTYKGQHVRVSLNQLTDVTAPSATPPNSLLGTVGEGATAGQAEWEPLHLDYIQSVVLGPLPSSVADLSQRVTELEHTGEVVPPDLELTVDLYSGSFTRIMGCDPITASPSQRIRLTLATVPGPNGTVFADLSGISGTGAVWADFGGTIGKVVDTSGTSINGATLKEAIRRGQIITVHRGTDGSHPTLVAEKVENPADTGSSLTLDALKDVTAPANTPTGKFIGTTAVGEWGPVDSPADTAVEMLLGTNQIPNPWQAQAYASGQLVAHPYPNGVPSYWWTVAPAAATDVPGVSAVWVPLNMAAVSNRAYAAQSASIPMDPKGIVHQWDPGTAYRPNDLVWAETDGMRYYYSSDINQTGGASPSPTNLATWSMINGYEIMTLSSLTTASMRSLAAGMWKKWTGTQAAYDALTVKDPGTLYAVTG